MLITMLLEIILISLPIIALLIAAYADIKTREVPDWLTYSLIFSALGIRAIFSLELGWHIILAGILGFAFCFLLACLLYYTDQWGGGDSKLLMGMGGIIGITYPLDNSSFALLLFFVALLLFGAVWGLVWMGIVAVSKWHIFIERFKFKLLTKYKIMHIFSAAASLVFLLLAAKFPLIWPLAIFPIGIFYVFVFVSAVEKSCFTAKVSPMKLTEGDWLAEPIFVKGERIMRKKTLLKGDILKLRELRLEKKIRSVTVKEGIPFVPGFLLAYLLITFGKGIISRLLSSLFA